MWHFKLVNWGNYPRVKQVGALWQDTLSPVVKDTCLRKFTSISKFGQVFKVSDISQKNTSPFSVFYHQLWALSIICVYYSDKERLPGSYHLLAISEMPPFVLFDCITTTHTQHKQVFEPPPCNRINSILPGSHVVQAQIPLTGRDFYGYFAFLCQTFTTQSNSTKNLSCGFLF